MSRSLKSMSRSIKNVENVFKQGVITNFILFLTLALSIGYVVNKTYFALVLLYLLAGLIYLLCKNLACALGISIILTNLFLSLNVKENFAPKKKETLKKQVEGMIKQNKIKEGLDLTKNPKKAKDTAAKTSRRKSGKRIKYINYKLIIKYK